MSRYIKPICQLCMEECSPVQQAGVNDGEYYYISDCCEEDVYVNLAHMTKEHYNQWIFENFVV